MNNSFSPSKFSKVLQAVVSLGSERLEESSDAGTSTIKAHPKTRVRYSGAARRRYKKQMQVQVQEGGKVTATKLTPLEAVSAPEGIGGSGQARTVKRPKTRTHEYP